MNRKAASKLERVIEAVRRHRELQDLIEGVNPFIVYRTDTGAVLARGVYGFEAAKVRATEIRRRYGLKFDQVKFKAERSQSGKYKRQQSSRIEYSNRYNPSKGGRFRVKINPDGSTADID